MADPKGINLLVVKKEISVKKAQTIRLAKVGSIVLLIFYCLVVISLFSVWAYLQRESQRIQQELTLKKQKIAALKKVESLQIFLKQRLSSLDKILSEKELDYKEILSFIEGLSSPEVTLGGINLSADGQLSFSGIAANAPSLAIFLEEVSREEGIFSKVFLSSVSRVKDGDYKFALDVEVKQ